jgi:hypothetical protein
MKESKDLPLHLSSSQRRHLEISLGQVLAEMEEAALWFERWPLPEGIQDRARQALEDLRNRIRETARSLGLSPSGLRPDPVRRLESLAGHWWSTVLDCRSQVLKGYGEVDPAVAPRLDPRIEDLAASLLQLEGLPKGGKAGPRGTPEGSS